MGGITKIKWKIMVFENNGTKLVASLDPAEGERYKEIVRADDDVDHIYNLTTWDEDWINLINNGRLNWENDSPYFSDWDEELENWKNQLNEVYALHCNRVTKSLQCLSSNLRQLPYYDGLTNVNMFLGEI